MDKEKIEQILVEYGVSFTDALADRLLKEFNPCENAINREELLKAIDTYDKFGYTETGCFVREPGNDYVPYIHYDDVIKCIKGMPPVTPQPKTGRWIKEEPPMVERYPFCSECGFVNPFENALNYCPNCGAKMQGVEDEVLEIHNAEKSVGNALGIR